MARHIRKGDTVMLKTGREQDRGRTGKVMQVLTQEDRVLVEGINVRKRHVRPSQQNPQGGVINKEMPVHISNVMPVDTNGKATRVRFVTHEDGSKVRVAATTGETLGAPLKKPRD